VEHSAARIWASLRERTAQGGAAPDVVCMHVRRGDKLLETDKYPHLAAETSAESILATLTPHIPQGALLYIATNEPDTAAYFAPLEPRYRVSSLSHFSWLVGPQQFLPSSLALVDYAVLAKCTKLVHTFADEPPKGFGPNAAGLTLSKSPR
jgi:hypothetical protein